MVQRGWTDDDWRLIRAAVVRMRSRAVALVGGALGGASLFFVTAWLLLKGGDPVGPHLALLGQFFPGYSVTWPGAVLGLLYGALTGSLLGWVLASIYNRVALRRRSE